MNTKTNNHPPVSGHERIETNNLLMSTIISRLLVSIRSCPDTGG